MGELRALPRTLAGFKGAASQRAGESEGRGMEREERGSGGGIEGSWNRAACRFAKSGVVYRLRNVVSL